MTLSVVENNFANGGRLVIQAVLAQGAFLPTGGVTAALTAGALAAMNSGNPDFWAPLTGRARDNFPNRADRFIFGAGNQQPSPNATGMDTFTGPGGVKWRMWKEGNQRVIRVKEYRQAALTAVTVSAANALMESTAATGVGSATSGLGQGPLMQAGTGFVDTAGAAVQTGAEMAFGALPIAAVILGNVFGPDSPAPDYTPPTDDAPPVARPAPLLPIAAIVLAALFL